MYVNGGIGTYVAEAAALLRTSGQWEVDVLTDLSFVPLSMRPDWSSAETYFEERGVRLLTLTRQTRSAWAWPSADLNRADRYQQEIRRLHARHRYDLIEFPDWRGPGFFTVRQKRTTGAFADTRLVVHLHSSTGDVASWRGGGVVTRGDLYCRYIEDYVKAHADVVLSPTEYLLTPLREKAGVGDRLFFRNGYPLVSPPPAPEQSAHAPCGERPVTVACVSRLEVRKGQDILAKAIRRLAQTAGVSQPVEFVFCGNDAGGLPGDGSMAQSLRRILHGVPNWSIRPAMPRAALLHWLATEVDICVVPSKGDNYPNVVLEAAQAGCLLVCSNAGGIPELILDYRLRAAVTPVNDVSRLADAIAQAIIQIRNEPGIRRRLMADFEAARQGRCQATLDTYRVIAESPSKAGCVPRHRRAPEPRVSVLVLAGCGGGHIRRVVQSAYASNHGNVEVVLVTDGPTGALSTPWMAALQEEFPALRVAHRKAEDSRDLRNCGLTMATGEFIVVLDADCRLMPNMLSRAVQVLLARPTLSYVTTYMEPRPSGSDAQSLPQPLGATALLFVENTVGRSVAMIRRGDLDKVGGYADDLSALQDWNLWLTFQGQGFEGDVIPEALCIHDPVTREDRPPVSRQALRDAHHAVLRRHEPLVRLHALTISDLLVDAAASRHVHPFGSFLKQAPTLFAQAWRLVAGDPVWALRYAIQRMWTG